MARRWHAIIAADTVRISRTRAFVGVFLALVAALVVFARFRVAPSAIHGLAGRRRPDLRAVGQEGLARLRARALQGRRDPVRARLRHGGSGARRRDHAGHRVLCGVGLQAVHGVRRRAGDPAGTGSVPTIRSAGTFRSFPISTGAITIGQLVHHTSGLRDLDALALDRRPPRGRPVRQRGDPAARREAEGAQLSTWHGISLYSNTGYALPAAIIIGRATGTSFGSFVETNIFAPLGMTASRVGDDAARLVRGRAYGYSRAPGGELRLDTPGGERVGAGGVFTDVHDSAQVGREFLRRARRRAIRHRSSADAGRPQRWPAAPGRVGAHARHVSRAEDRRARRIARRLPGAPDPVPRSALQRRVSVQPRQHRAGVPSDKWPTSRSGHN